VNIEQSFIVKTLGCKLNQLESEAISDTFLKAGYKKSISGLKYADFPSVIIINTCTVTSKADQKARREIRKVLRDYPDSTIIVTGCYAQLDRDELLGLEPDCRHRLFVVKKDEVLGFINKNFIEKISHTSNQNVCRTETQSFLENVKESRFQFNPVSFSGHTRSFLKIQDGCDNQCTYCRIRLARGQSISLEAAEVLSRLRMLEKDHAEAVLTGVNICQYEDSRIFYHEPHDHYKSDLPDLLTYLINNTEKINIRLSSLEPESIDENFVSVISHKRIRPHFHLSVQSCSSKILEKMGRIYDGQTVEKAVSLLRSAKEDPFIACDIITGFPGETDIEFDQTYSICKNLDFAWIHVFPYSKRPGTPAYSFREKVHESEVSKRVQIFTGLAKKGREAYVRRWLGNEVDVLIESKEKRTSYLKQNCRGVSENYLKTLVRCNGKTLLPGIVVRCKLIDAGNFEDFDVVGELV